MEHPPSPPGGLCTILQCSLTATGAHPCCLRALPPMVFSTLLRSLFWCFLGTRLRGPRGKGTLRGHQRQRARTRTLRPASPRGRASPLQLRRKGLSPGSSQFRTSSELSSFCHACCQTPLRRPSPQPSPQALVSTEQALGTTPGSAALEVCTLESLTMCSIASNLVRRGTPQQIWT